MKMAETSSSGPNRARASGGPLELVSVQTAFGPIVFGPFEYSAQTVKINYSAQFFSAQNDSALSNSAQRSTTGIVSLDRKFQT
jgi:hypothetical protein